MNLKIFVLTDDDVRLKRRLLRDVNERSRTIESVLDQYNGTVKKSYEEFIKPTMKYADAIIPWGDFNKAGLNLIIEDINIKLKDMGISPSIPNKQMKYKWETELLDKLKTLGLKNMLTWKEDQDMTNLILSRWMVQQECVFNKYIRKLI